MSFLQSTGELIKKSIHVLDLMKPYIVALESS